MIQLNKQQWERIWVGFVVTALCWFYDGVADYRDPKEIRTLASIGRFFMPIGTILGVWYLGTKKGKPPS